MKRPRGTCSVCGKDVALKANGTVQGHGFTQGPNGYWCQGSMAAPVAKHHPVPSHATAGLPKFACDECGDWWPCANSGEWTMDNPDEAEALRDDEEVS